MGTHNMLLLFYILCALGHSIPRNRKRVTPLIGYAIRVTRKISIYEIAP